MIRDSAAGRVGPVTNIGIGTYVDEKVWFAPRITYGHAWEVCVCRYITNRAAPCNCLHCRTRRKSVPCSKYPFLLNVSPVVSNQSTPKPTLR